MRRILLISLLLMWIAVTHGEKRGLKVVTKTPDGDLLELYDDSWAVVIGVNQYEKWPRLQYAVNDAEAVRDKLVTLGFPQQNVIYLTDGEATKDRIELILGDELRRKVGEDDRVFIYFAGHGQTEDLPGGKQEGYENHPVIEVSWYGAKAYCEWAEKHLPTEEEWQRACQGQDGRTYPWGNGKPAGSLANYYTKDDGYDRTAPVGSFPAGAGPYGALDMAGNAWEWTAAADGRGRVLRGGSWKLNKKYLSCTHHYKLNPDTRQNHIGFRCAR